MECPWNMYQAKTEIATDNSEVATYPMKFHVEATGIANRLSFCIPAPEGGGRSVTVGTRQTQASWWRLEASMRKDHTAKSTQKQSILINTARMYLLAYWWVSLLLSSDTKKRRRRILTAFFKEGPYCRTEMVLWPLFPKPTVIPVWNHRHFK